MSVTWEFTPGPNALPAVRGAALAAVADIAEHVLAESQPLVPVDTGALQASGRVSLDGTRAAVSYEGIAEDGYDYGIRQHEDMTLHHPNGGQAKFLEQPMNAAGSIALRIIAEHIGEVLGW